jgi:superfamily II DNA or RNA helicase
MTRDDIQAEAIKILKGLSANSRVGLGISMGVGKTKICLEYINYLSSTRVIPLKTLVIAPKVSIHASWKDEIIKHGYEDSNLDVTYGTYLSLSKRNLSNYDLIILDECHNLLRKHDTALSNYKGCIVGVTGTPPKVASSEKGEMVAKHCPIRFTYMVDDAVSDGILNDYMIYVHMLDLDTRKNYFKKTKNGGYYTSEYEDYMYWCRAIDSANGQRELQMKRILRMKGLMGYPSKEVYAKELLNYINDKVILFANTKDQASRLCSYSYFSGNKSSESNLTKFKSGDIFKLACVLQLNEGVNIPDLKQGIIMHSYGNERKSSQRLGRLLRLNPDETGKIHILCYRNTVDETWVKSALEDYDSSKVMWVSKSSKFTT